MKLVVPLVSQGELIGLLNLGPRLSEQDYSSDDRKLLDNLAAQAAPAVRVGQLVREQEVEVRARERIEQELEVARLIQQNFLPKELPDLPGWQVAAYYRPARDGRRRLLRLHRAARRHGRARRRRRHRQGRAGGDGDGRNAQRPPRLGPAARRARRGARARQRAPLPRHPAEDVRHLPLRRPRPGDRRAPLRERRSQPAVRPHRRAASIELRATGHAARADAGDDATRRRRRSLAPGESVLLHTDGLVEAHDPSGEMFGFPRLDGRSWRAQPAGDELIDRVLAELDAVHRPRLGAGGRHHAGRAPAHRGCRDARVRERRRPRPRRVRRSRASPATSGSRWRASPTAVAGARRSADPPRAAEDRGRRGDDERDRARQREPTRSCRVAGPRRRVGRRARACASPTRAASGRSRSAETPDLEAKLDGPAEAPRLGPVPDQEHGGRDGRLERRDPPHRRARAPPERRRRCQRPGFETQRAARRRRRRRSTSRGEIDASAEEASNAAYDEAAGRQPATVAPQLRRRRLHQLDRHRPDRGAPRQGPEGPASTSRPAASPTTTGRSSRSPGWPTSCRSSRTRRAPSADARRERQGGRRNDQATVTMDVRDAGDGHERSSTSRATSPRRSEDVLMDAYTRATAQDTQRRRSSTSAASST